MYKVEDIKIHIPLVVIFVYVFFNSAGLPHGLLYTVVFTPFLYIWLLLNGKTFLITKFFLVFFPFLLVQLLLNDIDIFYYIRSYMLFLGMYITIYSLSMSLDKIKLKESLFITIIKFNFYLFIFSFLIRYSSFSSYMWVDNVITAYTDSIARLKMFTYEPSYYSTVLVPFVVFAFSRFIYNINFKTFFLLMLILIPLLFSYSMGVLGALVLSILISSSVYFRDFIFRKKSLFLLITVLAIMLLILFTENMISTRVYNILNGADTSGSNRIFESTIVGFRIADMTNLWFGSGFGQAKIFAVDLFEEFWPGLGINRLTNTVADTLATFGVIGLVLRFLLELLLFFYTKVFNSYYRLILFLFIFIYQFTGSYLMNLAEYFIWLLAFKPVIEEPKWKLKRNQRMQN